MPPADDDVEVVSVISRQTPGAGPSRQGRPGKAPAAPLAGRRRSGATARQQDVVDLTNDDDDIQITQVRDVKRPRLSAGAAGGPVLGGTAALVAAAAAAAAAKAPPPPPPSPKGYKCTICLEKMDGDMATTTCGHMFCYPCISAWVQKSSNCPQCRTKVTKSKIIRIYPPQ
ncbi:hypothetical protein HYH03_008129 [Edaphochlamys debaryana]|uniref:RING-type domain-containing protein n=1 Tax=Edaphochlamys debaryana TaxID=47281 RepID=A0A835Y1Q7_9CHLO|nr:hypothetical protein HYH03_008129 [Edaphochlamys debaryana]|eukprot:KAG2493612.1 hypothetical protein HYH03_008129 [Edaphochlamys debaryana]